MIVLPRLWEKKWAGKSPFEQIFALQGDIFKLKDNRKTFCFELFGERYFAKLHSGVGWKKIIKYGLRLRRPVLTAENEWNAILLLEQLNIATTPLVAYGKEGCNPARIRSFVITKELSQTVSLEDLCKSWPESPPEPEFKRALITKVAQIAKKMHANGLNHRDFYICHFLLHRPDKTPLDASALRIYLIDLHRVRQRQPFPKRWRIKDIAGLYFSAMDIGLTRRDIFRFIKLYTGKTLRKTLMDDALFWRNIQRRAAKLYRKHG